MRFLVLGLAAFSAIWAHAEPKAGSYFLGTSAFMLANLDRETTEPPRFAQLNLGYYLTSRDSISLELITWRYYAPHGALWDATTAADKFPGHVTSHGAGLAYQRFLGSSSNFYLALHATWFRQEYRNNIKELSEWGQQLFVTLRAGYRIEVASGRLFIEPSLAVTHWPIESGMPADFQAQEDKWRKFQVEPGAHLGFTF
ncbi:MAG TPA: hypothetical protein PLZ57_02445 [Pseudobdellovibrionaceae bacterium]|nr:hypothetical protein [Pseudobdellovibrionaceae bacterium]